MWENIKLEILKVHVCTKEIIDDKILSMILWRGTNSLYFKNLQSKIQSLPLIKVSWFRNVFFYVFDFFQTTNKNKSTWCIIVVKWNSFLCFLEELSAWKNPYDFVRPLAWYNFINEKQNWKLQKLIVWADVRNLPREDDHAIRSSLKMAQSHSVN